MKMEHKKMGEEKVEFNTGKGVENKLMNDVNFTCCYCMLFCANGTRNMVRGRGELTSWEDEGRDSIRNETRQVAEK